MTSKMFLDRNGKRLPTWNPVVGCTHNCVYCWARDWSKRQKHRCEYCYRFVPHLHVDRLKPFNARRRRTIFVVDMGDLFCDSVPDEWIKKVLRVVQFSRGVNFLFLTKNPARYFDFLDMFPFTAILGTTIETNRDYKVSNAPSPFERFEAMKKLDWPRKFVAIEPIMDFDFKTLVDWIRKINPVRVDIGYDNYNNNLPEPPLEKTLKLIEELSKITKVFVKNLKREEQQC